MKPRNDILRDLASWLCSDFRPPYGSPFASCFGTVDALLPQLQKAKVHKDLPGILKDFTKAVLRANLTSEEDIIMFSINYFQYKSEGDVPGTSTQQ